MVPLTNFCHTFAISWHVVQQMPADVVVLWQEAAEGKLLLMVFIYGI
ncbi:hypothetical protein HanPSC8_Chr11g0459301 [Helianthus annuus]|nr:hypothetical protein HanPSC8_Chr11g0459301 [Helianthus annuus]